MNRNVRISALAATVALALAACSATPDKTPTASPTGPAAPTFKACMVSDEGGFDDKSFNQSGYEGLVKAQEDFGIEIAKAESKDANDYRPNIDAMVDANCDIIFAVGYNLAAAVEPAAADYPDQHFAQIDAAFTDDSGNPSIANVKGLVFATNEPSFLAGYAAARDTKTGVVGTFGGGPFPGVTDFMDGFYAGVQYYNTENGTKVAVLGWDGKTGIADVGFSDLTVGKSTGESFIAQGADIILPVAGPVGLGTAQAAQEANGVKIIGVDSDWSLTAPEYADVIYGSILKEIGASVYNTIDEIVNGDGWSNATYVGTYENGGVGLAGITGDFSDLIAKIISGEIATQ